MISIHAPHTRSDSHRPRPLSPVDISIHAPHTRSDAAELFDDSELAISIHAPHARSDPSPTSPSEPVDFNFNPRSSCEERHRFDLIALDFHVISIHAPHARSDCPASNKRRARTISIHAPHARSDLDTSSKALPPTEFQSTLLMRGATRQDLDGLPRRYHFNPRSSCEERHGGHTTTAAVLYFNPRSSCEERRGLCRGTWHEEGISIHAPHARSDLMLLHSLIHRPHFNPRSSCEERQRELVCSCRYPHISIHTPHARSDSGPSHGCGNTTISIHAPHARSDGMARGDGKRLRISIHAPHARSDPVRQLPHSASTSFQSTLLMRGATSSTCDRCAISIYFNPRSSCEERR